MDGYPGGPPPGTGNMMSRLPDLETVRRVLREKRDLIRRQFPSTGMGIGKDSATGGYNIVVYLATARDMPIEPVEIDGVPVAFSVTGRFEAQSQRER